jgi:hypothetical protein
MKRIDCRNLIFNLKQAGLALLAFLFFLLALLGFND